MKYILIILFITPFVAQPIWSRLNKTDAVSEATKKPEVVAGQIWLDFVIDKDDPFDEGRSGYDSVMEVRLDHVKWKNRFNVVHSAPIWYFLETRTITDRKSIVE